MPHHDFPHLPLIQKIKGAAKLHGSGQLGARVAANQQNRAGHGNYLSGQFQSFAEKAQQQKDARAAEHLPEISGGASFLLQIPDEDDEVFEWLSVKLGLELVAEYDDGYIIVATEDTDLQELINLANEFIHSERGSGNMASILEVYPDPADPKRIHRILDEALHPLWPFDDDQDYILDISIEVAPMNKPPATPPGLRSNSTAETRSRLEAKFQEESIRYWLAFDEMKDEREDAITALVAHYQGEIKGNFQDAHIQFPDSFCMQIQMSGKGFTDLIKNHPNLFEVTVPDEIEQPYGSPLNGAPDGDDFELLAPSEDAPSICVIDSGMQEGHRWLENAISKADSFCFIPHENSDDVADYVAGGGHGTRVASACLYPTAVPQQGEHQAPFWLLNARVLDDRGGLRSSLFPPDLMNTVVTHYTDQTALYQHSIAADRPCRPKRMSAWATAIDFLSYQEDVLFFQAAGNLPTKGTTTNPGILDHLLAGRKYPDYLEEGSSRIANPAQSLQALTVGSISHEYYTDGIKQSIAPSEHPSAFTRSGFGMWDSIKPEVVEFGGDWLRDTGTPPALSLAPKVCPELARSTLQHGPAVDRDMIGTSFATPKVAHIGGLLAAQFPNQSPLLYRALIVNSARWPQWAEAGTADEQLHAIKTMGYGTPSIARATGNDEGRVTLIQEQVHEIEAGSGMIFAVPIPDSIRAPGGDYPVRIDVTLSYVAEPRRTRKSRRGYLGTWLDWKASKKGEAFETFKARTIKDLDAEETASQGNFEWMLGEQKNHGKVKGASRSNGTVQKDWTVARSHELPDSFGVVVRGHKGWDRKNTAATARFTLVVSFEVLGEDVNLYQEVRAAVQAELEIEERVPLFTS
jgi:hypothetical protein